MKRQRPQRDTKKGAMEKRMSRLHRLFYEMTNGESQNRMGQPDRSDLAARAVMIDALYEMGSSRTADALQRWGTRKLGGTLLLEKIRRTIFGARVGSRPLFEPRKPAKMIWLVLEVGPRGRGQQWLRLGESDILRNGDRPYLFEVGVGYSSFPKVVFSDDGPEGALDDAEERWPHLFLDELDDDDVEEAEDRGEDIFNHPTKRNVMVRRSDDVYYRGVPGQVVRARLVDPDRRLAVIVKGYPDAPEMVEYQA